MEVKVLLGGWDHPIIVGQELVDVSDTYILQRVHTTIITSPQLLSSGHCVVSVINYLFRFCGTVKTQNIPKKVTKGPRFHYVHS